MLYALAFHHKVKSSTRSLLFRINSSLIQALHAVLAVRMLNAAMIVFFTDRRQLVSVSTKQDNSYHFAVLFH